MSFNFYVVDAFVNRGKPFSGNPAAVVILGDDSDISDEKKQLIAGQFNLSETVFVSRLDDGGDDQFLIRWFSLTNEVELCGHATMAASYILFTETNRHSDIVSISSPIKFRTKFGAHLQTTFDGTYLTLNFPVNEPAPLSNVSWLEPLKQAALGNELSAELIIDAQMPPNRYLLLRLKDDVDIHSVQPDFNRLLEIDTEKKVDAVMVTKKSNYQVDGTHFESRFFAPWFGVNEDPVTGSSFTVLVPYWSKVYLTEFNQKIDTFTAVQASKRSGLVRNELLPQNRVLISGKAKKFASGIFQL